MILEADRTPQFDHGLLHAGNQNRTSDIVIALDSAAKIRYHISRTHNEKGCASVRRLRSSNRTLGIEGPLWSFTRRIKGHHTYPMPLLLNKQSIERCAKYTGALGNRVSGGIRQQAGFTLIEILIALAIVAILAAIAMPSFQQQIRQARRADGQTALMRLAIAQEHFRADCPRYASQIGGTRGCADTNDHLGESDLSTDGHYRLAVESATSSAFKLTATPVGAQIHDKAGGTACNPLTLDQDAHRTPKECW